MTILGMKDWTFYLIIVCILICTNIITALMLCVRFRSATQDDNELLSDKRRGAGEKLVLAECELDGATRLAHDWEANGVEVDHSLDITLPRPKPSTSSR